MREKRFAAPRQEFLNRKPCYVGEGQARKIVWVRLHRGRGLLLSWFSYPAGGAGAASAPRSVSRPKLRAVRPKLTCYPRVVG
jgi:hypothetical protein